jgi:hypothetical protein
VARARYTAGKRLAVRAAARPTAGRAVVARAAQRMCGSG